MPNVSVNLSGAGTIVGDATYTGRLTAAGLSLSIDGTAGTPAINRTTDPDTGIHWDPGGNYLRLDAGGAFNFGVTAASCQSITGHTMNAGMTTTTLTANSTATFNSLASFNDRVNLGNRVVDIPAVGSTISPLGSPLVRITLSAGSIASTATPFITDGVEGQELHLLRSTDAGNLTLSDETIIAGTNLRLDGGTVVLGPRDSIKFRWLGALGDWVEVSRVNAL